MEEGWRPASSACAATGCRLGMAGPSPAPAGTVGRRREREEQMNAGQDESESCSFNFFQCLTPAHAAASAQTHAKCPAAQNRLSLPHTRNHKSSNSTWCSPGTLGKLGSPMEIRCIHSWQVKPG
ncbi:uncharacterized protein VTP21DRAFT_964 [Calcarisporiella thermophila]|uniref:uncharacterized protein n=1 Tax=Calcarisporiella thermophila TaxID=911321 RepID=UPI003743A17C